MEFIKYNLENKTERLSGMFRPAGSTYGYQGDNTPNNVKYAEAIELLTEAFGPAIVYEDWREVVDVDAWPGHLKRKIAKDTWYWNKAGVWSELYLTSELQMNYLALVMDDIHICETA